MPGVHCLKCGMGKDLICERSVCPCDCHDPVEVAKARELDRMRREALRKGLAWSEKHGYAYDPLGSTFSSRKP